MAKEKKKVFNERNMVNKLFKEYLMYYTISTFRDFNEDDCNLIFDAIDVIINSNASKSNEELLIEDNDYAELRLHVSTIKELIFIGQNFKLKDIVDIKIGEKVLSKQIKRLQENNISILEYSKIATMLRNIIMIKLDWFLGSLFYEYNIEDAARKKTIENLTRLIAVSNEVVSIYILFEEFKPKNYVIDRFSVKNNKLIAKYKATKFAPDNLLNSYKETKNIKKLRIELFDYWVNSNAVNLKLMGYVNDAYIRYKIWENNIPEAVCVKSSSIMPFINSTIDNDNICTSYKTVFDNNLNKIVTGKRYAMPKNGCLLTFKKEKSVFTKAKVHLENDVYLFEVYLRENSLKNSEGKYASKIFLSLHKKDINDMIQSDGLAINDVLCNYSMVSRYVKSSEIFFEEGDDFRIVNAMLNSWMLCCLYCIFVDIGNQSIEISNIEKTHKDFIPKGSYNKYKTAYIRRLPDGYKASEDAKNRAKLMDLILDEGYTFVREYIPSEDKAMRKLTIKN